MKSSSSSSLPGGYTVRDVLELMDIQDDNGEVLRNRIKAIGQYSTLGPPDLCYLHKQYYGGHILQANKSSFKLGSYHYVHGLNLSTPASVSAYITLMIKNIEEEKQSLFSRGEWRVVKGYFCVFDSFSRVDIHIQITIPGTMKLYGFTLDNELVTVNDDLWERALVSSGLRSMYPQEVPAGKYFPEFTTAEQLQEFLNAFKNVLREYDLPYKNIEETEKSFAFSGSKALHLLTEYIIRKRIFSQGIEFYKEAIKEQPKFVLPLNKLYMTMGKHLEGLQLVAGYLIQQPDSPQLLYAQAKNLLAVNKNEDAYQLIQLLSGLVSQSFEVWILLAEVFFKLESYDYCLVAANQAAEFASKQLEIGDFPDITMQNSQMAESGTQIKQITQPKESGSIDQFPSIFVLNQQSPDILKIKRKPTPLCEKQSEIQLDLLSKLNGSDLSEEETHLYSLLIAMKNKLGWDTLIKLRGSIFILNQDEFSETYNRMNDFPYKIIKSQESQNSQKDSIPQFSSNSNRQQQQQQQQEKQSQQQSQQIQINNAVQEFPAQFDGSENSDSDEELPQFLRDEQDEGKQKNYGMANIKDPQIQKNIQRKLHQISVKQQKRANNPKFEKSNHITELTEDSVESERVQNFNAGNKLQINGYNFKYQTTGLMNKQAIQLPPAPPQKRLIHKTLDNIFNSLYEDMAEVIRWQNEDKQREDLLAALNSFKITKHNQIDYNKIEQQLFALDYSSYVWLLRSKLADRLQMQALSEKAHKEILSRNYCFYSFQKLLQFALESTNQSENSSSNTSKTDAKPIIYLLAKLLDEMESFGVKAINILPSWIEDIFLSFISRNGLRSFRACLSELKFEDQVLSNLIEKAKYWKILGIGENLALINPQSQQAPQQLLCFDRKSLPTNNNMPDNGKEKNQTNSSNNNVKDKNNKQ